MTKSEYILSCINRYGVHQKYPRLSMWYDLCIVSEFSTFELTQIVDRMNAIAVKFGDTDMMSESRKLQEIALLFDGMTTYEIASEIEKVSSSVYAKDFLDCRTYCLSKIWH